MFIYMCLYRRCPKPFMYTYIYNYRYRHIYIYIYIKKCMYVWYLVLAHFEGVAQRDELERQVFDPRGHRSHLGRVPLRLQPSANYSGGN